MNWWPLSLKELLKLFKPMINPINEKNNRLILFSFAVQALGTDASPNDVAPDEFGCAESINQIHQNAFGFQIGGGLSTYRMYKALLESLFFIKIDQPSEGDIVISPTGYGNGKLPSGHVGIVGERGKIMSSSSATGRFEENYTIKTWENRYRKIGGYPIHYFRRV